MATLADVPSSSLSTRDELAHHPNPWLRIRGVHPPVTSEQAARLFPDRLRSTPSPSRLEPPPIDPDLPVDPSAPMEEEPRPGMGYGGFTPVQRAAFLRWLAEPTEPAPAAFRRLYLTMLEAHLLTGGPSQLAPLGEHLDTLAAQPHWAQDEPLARLALLHAWLAQDPERLVRTLDQTAPHPRLLGIAFGWLAGWGQPLSPRLALAGARAWKLAPPEVLQAMAPRVARGVDSLAATLEIDPLAHAWPQAQGARPDHAGAFPQESWRPWPTLHRGLRIEVPQVDLRPGLAPLLRDLLDGLQAVTPVAAPERGPSESASPQTDQTEPATAETASPDWHLLLEFRESRSALFPHVLKLARKRPGYRMLMDEDRHVVHRIAFRKGEMRAFWRLWHYVSGWKHVAVYRGTERLRTWQVWPGSPYLR